MLLAWLVAHETARAVGMVTGVDDRFTAVAVGGCIGGLGAALSVAVFERRPRTGAYLLLAAVVGGVSALGFGSWVRNYNLTLWNKDWKYLEFQPLRLRYAFAIWQAAVGTYLYLACNWPKRQASRTGPEDGAPL
jgi:branched-subunit amino acid ABC-type transport system permease component